jgi:hypothetical protein
LDKNKSFESEEALTARVRELTAEVAKLRHEIETAIQEERRPASARRPYSNLPPHLRKSER